jgi:hypothetical protein
MNKQITPTDLFLAVLALLLISVSFYQTWLGLEQIFGSASFVIALVLSLLLLFLLWVIRNAKLEGKSTTSLIGIYIFIASFCFIANFNALYTRFMKTDIYTTELRSINEKFNNLETAVESNLNYSVADAKTRQAIRSEINLLKIQITDPKNKGIGAEAKQIISIIEQLLGKKITPLTPISNNPSGYEDLANRMEQQIIEMVYNLTPEEKNIMTDIHNASVKWNTDIQNTLLLPENEINSTAQGQIDKSLTEYNKLGNRANAILGAEKLKFEPVISKTQEVGKIGYAFNHAITNFGMYQFVVFLGCILLDFVIVIIILLITSSENSNHHQGGLGKRKGKTFIPNN